VLPEPVEMLVLETGPFCTSSANTGCASPLVRVKIAMINLLEYVTFLGLQVFSYQEKKWCFG
jgi:hypothetical protein